MRKTQLAFGLVAALFAGSLAQAGPLINPQQEVQGNRIERNIENGNLNENEAQRLQNSQERIANREAKMRADDGRLSRGERRRLNRAQAHQRHSITKLSHNRR